jgi:hypothetical protein
MPITLKSPKGGKKEVKRRWIRECELPFSASFARRLVQQGVLVSALLRIPGSTRSVRVFDGEALDRYLERLAQEQHPHREEVSV